MLTVKFWGVRGSIPVPGHTTVKVGGNTSCIEIINDKKELLIIDAGTGIRQLGNYIVTNYMKQKINECSIFLTHTHWDHIQGFPFFVPIYIKDFRINIYGPARQNDTLQNILSGQMNYAYYPVKLSDVKAKLQFFDLDTKPFTHKSYQIQAKTLNHPIKTYGYRIQYENKVITTVFDHEIYRNIVLEENPKIMEQLKLTGEKLALASQKVQQLNQEIIDFIGGSHLVILDSQFTEKEYYAGKQGWGHGPIEFTIKETLNKNKPLKNIVLFHHAPEKNDEELIKMKKYLENFVKSCNYPLNLILAKEGLRIKL